jgi:class 3 adenylate cyclase
VTEQRVQRRLAAILAADVVGYSALMQRAEEATYAEVERLKCEVIEPGLSRHDGRLIKTTGDGAFETGPSGPQHRGHFMMAARPPDFGEQTDQNSGRVRPW